MSVRRADALTVSFPLIDSTNRPARLSGLTLIAGDCKISKDGGSFSNTTNLPAEIGSTGRYSLALTSAEMDADWVHVYVSKTGTVDDWDQLIGTSGNPSGTVQTNGGNTSSTFLTDLTSSTNDFWKDCLLLFMTGSLAGQVKKISAYNGSTKFVTLASAYTGTPSNGDRFILVNL
jgi:hypothetical protein